MPQFRLTQKVAKTLKITALSEPSSMTHLLEDWFIDFETLSRKKLVMAVHRRSLFTFFFFYKETGKTANIFHRLQALISDFLKHHELTDRVEQLDRLFSSPIVFCKTKDKKVLGHMNDFKRILSFYDFEDGLSVISNAINTLPIDYGNLKQDWSNPSDKFLETLGIKCRK